MRQLSDSEIASLLASVTPEHMLALAREIDAQQEAVNRGSVALEALLNAVLAKHGLGVEARPQVEFELRGAVMRAFAAIPSVQFIDGG